MATLQNDTTSVAATRVLAGCEAGADRRDGAESRRLVRSQALTELAAWDHVVDARPVVTLYEAFEDALWRRTFVDEMDEPLFLDVL